MTNEEMIEQQNAYYMAGYPSRRSEKKMTEEEPEIIKQGYQPIHSKNASVTPPNAGSHVRMEKHIAELEKENAELKKQVE